MTGTYEPKHMKSYEDDWDHCCFGGCSPMDEYGCCANMGWHRAGCPLNPLRAYDDTEHDIYVADGLRKHLAKPLVGNISRFCPDCWHKVVIAKRVCFGADPHNMYRCTECRWSGRNPGVSINA